MKVLYWTTLVAAYGVGACVEAHLTPTRELPPEAAPAPAPPPPPGRPHRQDERDYRGCLVCCGGRDTCQYDPDVPLGICAAIEQGGCEYVPIFRDQGKP